MGQIGKFSNTIRNMKRRHASGSQKEVVAVEDPLVRGMGVVGKGAVEKGAVGKGVSTKPVSLIEGPNLKKRARTLPLQEGPPKLHLLRSGISIEDVSSKDSVPSDQKIFSDWNELAMSKDLKSEAVMLKIFGRKDKLTKDEVREELSNSESPLSKFHNAFLDIVHKHADPKPNLDDAEVHKIYETMSDRISSGSKYKAQISIELLHLQTSGGHFSTDNLESFKDNMTSVLKNVESDQYGTGDNVVVAIESSFGDGFNKETGKYTSRNMAEKSKSGLDVSISNLSSKPQVNPAAIQQDAVQFEYEHKNQSKKVVAIHFPSTEASGREEQLATMQENKALEKLFEKTLKHNNGSLPIIAGDCNLPFMDDSKKEGRQLSPYFQQIANKYNCAVVGASGQTYYGRPFGDQLHKNSSAGHKATMSDSMVVFVPLEKLEDAKELLKESSNPKYKQDIFLPKSCKDGTLIEDSNVIHNNTKIREHFETDPEHSRMCTDHSILVVPGLTLVNTADVTGRGTPAKSIVDSEKTLAVWEKGKPKASAYANISVEFAKFLTNHLGVLKSHNTNSG